MQGTPFLFQHSHWQLSHAPTISSHNSSSGSSTSGNSGRRTDCTKYRRFPPWDHSHSTCSALHKDALLIVSKAVCGVLQFYCSAMRFTFPMLFSALLSACTALCRWLAAALDNVSLWTVKCLRRRKPWSLVTLSLHPSSSNTIITT